MNATQKAQLTAILMDADIKILEVVEAIVEFCRACEADEERADSEGMPTARGLEDQYCAAADALERATEDIRV